MAVRSDFTAGEVLAANDLNDTFAAKVDYALPTNAQTGTTYTFTADDAERLTSSDNSSAVTFTIPPQSSVGWGANTVLRVVNYGAGALTVDGGSGVTVTNTATTIAQYGAAVAIRTGSDAWTVVPFGGGDVPSATVSSPSATGPYTGTGVTYDYYTFTSSGTLTVDTAGFADVLLVGGGGRGTSARGGGGGAGGYVEVTDLHLPSGTLTVSVGAGGTLSGPGSPSHLFPLLSTGGGQAGSSEDGFDGGSGGGGAGKLSTPVYVGGSGITGWGNDGGNGDSSGNGGGGGGAGAAGGAPSNPTGGAGGNGTASSITGSSVTRAGGGGGRGVTTGGAGGSGGGGAGGSGDGAATSGTANTGGGGGGSNVGAFGDGGSGIVIVRVKV